MPNTCNQARDYIYFAYIPKLNFLGQGFQNLEHEQDRQTNIQTDVSKHITKPHLRMVIISKRNRNRPSVAM